MAVRQVGIDYAKTENLEVEKSLDTVTLENNMVAYVV